MPLQHAGFAALHGADFQKDPGQSDADVARQIERGLALRVVEVTAGLGTSAAIRAAFAEFFCDFDLLLTPAVFCVAWPPGATWPQRIAAPKPVQEQCRR
jgi:aspartyl-tRNA(Asn)/glutamyl-tRNA(Gln) amidotransferase subunit A